MPGKHKAAHVIKKKDDEEINIMDFLRKFRINYALILLFIFLLFGFYLRFYHIGYPVIGYHNWKVAHYITEARNFEKEGFFKHGFFVPMRDTTESIDEPADGEHNDTFPTISIVVGFLFKLFGESLFIARMANLLFSLASVPVFYFLVKELFDKEELAVISAFLMTINPMYVFFSHNVDVINPGIFFMVLGAYFYVTWVKYQLDRDKYSHLYLAALFIMLSIITKYTFAVIAIPILFSFPYKKYFEKKTGIIKPTMIAGIISAGFPAWFIYSEFYVKRYIFGRTLTANVLDSYEITKLIDLSIVWSSDFWAVMRSYVADNFTLLGMFFAVVGGFLLVFFYATKNRSKFGYKFMIGYLIGLFAFLFIMGFKLSGHNYHQFPVGPLVIFLIAYFMEVFAKNVSGFLGDNLLLKKGVYALIIVSIIFVPFSSGRSLYSHSQDSRDRMYNTQFPGLDIAGDYINEHAAPDERIFHSSGQSFGILWHAARKGYKPPSTVDYFQRAEKEFNVSWVFMYQWGIQSYFDRPEVMEYIRNNYRLVQIGLIPIGQEAQPIFFLFRKGGTFNETQINNMVQGKPVYNRIYQYTTSPYEVRFINLE